MIILFSDFLGLANLDRIFGLEMMAALPRARARAMVKIGQGNEVDNAMNQAISDNSCDATMI